MDRALCRSEAKGVPTLLVAPVPEKEGESGKGDEFSVGYDTGFYDDGAYTALPVPDSTSDPDVLNRCMLDEEDEDIAPQEAYYASLTDRFLELRSTLKSPPILSPESQLKNAPSSLVEAASASHKMNHELWRKHLLYRAPQMKILAHMNQETVIRGLTRLETLLSKRNLLADKEAKIIGAWSWGLLAKCRDLGEMISEEVGVLRMVAKTALKLAVNMRMSNKASQEMSDHPENDEEEDESEEANDDEQEQVGSESQLPHMEENSGISQIGQNNTDSVEHEANNDELEDGEISDSNESLDALAIAKQSLLAQVRCPTPSTLPKTADEKAAQHASDVEDRAFATLDMIVTIVGELYGQRDLLDARAAWGK